MTESKISEALIKEAWWTYLTTGDMPASFNAAWYERKVFRPLIKRMPSSPRCDICYIPFKGPGGWLWKTFLGVEPSKLNPRMCNLCERYATKYDGGVELEISMLFVDVRGSTSMAEKIPPTEFSRRIDLFYRAATEVFYRNNGLVEKLVGDQVAGFFAPGLAGAKHATVALNTAKKIMKSLGYGSSSGPWMPAGIGVNTGVAYVGSVHAHGGVVDISMLGDSVNTAARLTSLAAPGEILISEATRQAAGLSIQGMEARSLDLKGKSSKVTAWVMKVTQ